MMHLLGFCYKRHKPMHLHSSRKKQQINQRVVVKEIVTYLSKGIAKNIMTCKLFFHILPTIIHWYLFLSQYPPPNFFQAFQKFKIEIKGFKKHGIYHPNTVIFHPGFRIIAWILRNLQLGEFLYYHRLMFSLCIILATMKKNHAFLCSIIACYFSTLVRHSGRA